MADATIRDLQNHGAEVIDRVTAGEQVTITRNGRPAAELRPLGRAPLSAEDLVQRFRRLPRVDADSFRADVDAMVDQSV